MKHIFRNKDNKRKNIALRHKMLQASKEQNNNKLDNWIWMQIKRSLNFYSFQSIFKVFLPADNKRCSFFLMCYYLLCSSCKLYWETNELQETASDKDYKDAADCWDAKRNLCRVHKSASLPLYNLPLNKYLACMKLFVWTNTGSAHSSCKNTLTIWI